MPAVVALQALTQTSKVREKAPGARGSHVLLVLWKLDPPAVDGSLQTLGAFCPNPHQFHL